VLGEETSSRRLGMTLLAIFAALALCWATLGIYGVLPISSCSINRDRSAHALGAQNATYACCVKKGMLLRCSA